MGFEELNLDLQDDAEEGTSGIASPTIPIPASRHVNLTNISKLMKRVFYDCWIIFLT